MRAAISISIAVLVMSNAAYADDAVLPGLSKFYNMPMQSLLDAGAKVVGVDTSGLYLQKEKLVFQCVDITDGNKGRYGCRQLR